MQCFLLLFQCKNIFFHKDTSKVVLKKADPQTEKIHLPVNYRQIPGETEKMTVNYQSPTPICSTDNEMGFLLT